jgi:hypothetical protein
MEKETRHPESDELELIPERPVPTSGTRAEPKVRAGGVPESPPEEVLDGPEVGPVMINRETTGYDLPGAHPRAYGSQEIADSTTPEPTDSLSRFISKTASPVNELDDAEPTGIFPPAPRTLLDVGLSKAFLSDLTLKVIHYSGTPSAAQLTRRLGLSQTMVQQVLEGLAAERLIEVQSQSDLYTGNYRYKLSDKGYSRVLQALERTRYAGPVPVTAEQYAEVVRKLHSTQSEPQRGSIKAMLGDLVVSADTADSLGRALFSGKAAIIHGPSGNGKTLILDRFGRSLNGVFLMPYAIYAYGQVIRVFDQSIHEQLDQPEGENVGTDDANLDRRWVLVRRPVVVLGADIGPETLDLAYDPQARFYQAPPHIKAQGGVLIVDDFGRQKIEATELLTRWLLPMERGWDSLSLATGEKVSFPFQMQLLFATNKRIKDLADDALIRRILYKVRIAGPLPEEFEEITRQLCRKKRVLVEDGALEHAVGRLYGQEGLKVQASFARDLVEIVIQSATYDGIEPVFNKDSFDTAFKLFLTSDEDDDDYDD